MEWWLVYVVVGAVAGLLAGLLGVGGGVVVVPSLAFAFAAQGVAPQYVMPLALGTSLAAIVFTALASVRAHSAHGAVDWRIVARLTPGLILGALGGASVATRLSSNVLTVVFAVFLWGVATHLVLDAMPAQARPLPGRLGLLGVGGVIGFVSGVVGIGGGSLSVPFLTWCRVKLHEGIGTAAAAGFPIALAGAVGYLANGLRLPDLPHLSAGFIYLPALVGVALPSVVTAPIGARLAHRLPTGRLRKLFAAFLYLVGGRLLYPVLIGS